MLIMHFRIAITDIFSSNTVVVIPLPILVCHSQEKGDLLDMMINQLLIRIFIGILVAFLLVCCSKGLEVPVQEESRVPQIPVHSQMPLIWDDDGSPDGVIALLYFLRHPGVDVKAITVSCGVAHPNIFAQNLTRMLSSLGKTGIPVAAGRSTPLTGNNTFPEPWRKNSDDFWEIKLPESGEALQPISAAKLIVDVVNRSPDPVTVFVSGNHTNLTEALRLDSTIAEKIKTVESMGGALYVRGNIASNWPMIHNRVSEWNIWVDPLAASEVFASGMAINLTPLDATNKVVWKKSDAGKWKSTNVPEGVLAANVLQWMLRSWSPNGIYAWDLVAAVNATTPDLCEHQQVHVQVITKSGDQEGRTVEDKTAPPNANVCMTPNDEAMKRHVSMVFGQP